MADLSFSFHWSQASSAVVLAAAASSVASAASVAAAAVSDAASNALSKATVASGAAADGSNALSKITTRSATWDLASAASSAVAVLDGVVIKSIPGADSRAVHEIMVASNGEIKYVYSSNAAA